MIKQSRTVARADRTKLYATANERASRAIAKLGVLADDRPRLLKLTGRVELFLWKFLRARAHDAHRFFEAVEPVEVVALCKKKFEPGRVFHFFSERQDDLEFENSMTVGMSLLFAAVRQAKKRGYDPKTIPIFTLQRMLEQAIDEIDDLEDLLQIGAPP